MKVFEIPNGKKPIDAVAGINWNPLLPDNFKKNLKPLAKEHGKDLYVYWKSANSIVGLASTKEGASVGQVPVALIIAKALEKEGAPKHSLVAVASPTDPNIYFYVSRREGYIIPDGDTVGTEDEIKSRMLGDFGLATWDMVVCPDHWRINGSVSRTFESFLPLKNDKLRIPDTWRLNTVNVAWQKSIFKLVLTIAVPAIGLYAYSVWKNNEARKRAEQEAIAIAAQAEQQKAQALQKEPWPEIPNAVVFAGACEGAIRRTGLIVTNWALSELTCEGGSLVVKWERANTTALVSQMKAIHPAAVIDPSGAFATLKVQLSLPTQPAAPVVEAAPALATRIEHLTDFQNKYGVTVVLKIAPPPPAAVPGAEGPRWVDLGVTATTGLGLSTAARLLTAPAFRLNKITGSIKGGLIRYQLTGIQYAKP